MGCDCNVGDGERILSVLSGGMMLIKGLRKRSPSGWVMAAMGAGSLYRGVTGHCYLYEALNINTKGSKAEPKKQASCAVHADAMNWASDASEISTAGLSPSGERMG